MDCRTLQALPPALVSTDTGGSYAHQQELLQQFTGPALLSYNNAPFKKEDWESIQSLQQSGKAKNPFKVGKFGIGFNSVYDITGKRGDRIKKRVSHARNYYYNTIYEFICIIIFMALVLTVNIHFVCIPRLTSYP